MPEEKQSAKEYLTYLTREIQNLADKPHLEISLASHLLRASERGYI